MILASLVLAVHVAIIAFNIFGLVAIPLGGRRGWAWVREPIWRSLHVLSLCVVALQAAAGRACFLTIVQDELAGSAGGEPPLIMRWVNAVVFWPLPLWVFTLGYLALFGAVLTLLWLVPPRWRVPRRN